MSDHQKERDELTGVETTGHEWDGLKELNNPAPRWWLWIFIITIIWSVGYWVVYPAWPTLSGEGYRGGTVGSAEFNQYKKLAKEQEEILQRRAAYQDRFNKASFEQILQDSELYAFAVAGGKAAFKDNCATCHGTGGEGAKGYPNLNDDDWIWGGDPEAIYQTILYGIRNTHDDSRSSMMPAFGDMLPKDDLQALALYVHQLSHGGATDEAGHALYMQHCASCHGEDARGMKEFGAPDLADAIWLKSEDGSVDAILGQLRQPRHGVMPLWKGRLSDSTIRQLTVYVHSLGGGE